jgi:type I restriction enzyme S subunit
MENVGQYITKYVKGKVPKSLLEIPVQESLPYLSPDYLRGKGNPEFYAVPNQKTVQVDDGEVIVLWDGSNAGEIFISKRGILGSTMVKLEFDEDEIHKPYFSYSFQYLEYFLKAKTAGSGIPHADKGVIKRLDFFKPPKPEQTAIATILSKVDEAIEATQKSIKAAEKLKKALMQNLLTGKLKPDGTWRTENEFYETKIGMLPKSWIVKTIKEVSTQVTDGEHTTPERTESGYYLLSARNIKNGYLDLSKVDYVPEKELKRIQKRCNPQEGDILISCSGTIGNVCIAPEGINAGMVRSAALVKLNKDEIEPEFAELVLQSFNLQNQMKVSVASSVQGNIFQGAIKKLKIPYPPSKDERSQISETINRFGVKIENSQSKIKSLQRLKKSLMQNLLTGKVRLPEEFIKQFDPTVETKEEVV